jgi:hypothetical protein
MSVTFKKLWSEYNVGSILLIIILGYGLWIFFNYLSSKRGHMGSEKMTSTPNPVYSNSSEVVPANPMGQNEMFASAQGIQTSMPGLPQSCTKPMIDNPEDLLPKDTNSQWAQLNPQGKGELANINLLKAGYHTGIDTIGQTLRNANLQIRSEPPNPQLYVGPWNQSTIEPDFLRPPLEIGAGVQ